MIDLRYHVFSLVAVFVFFIVGVVVGVGLAGQGLVEEGERRRLNAQIDRLSGDLEEAEARVDALERQQRAGQEFVRRSYAVLVDDRLDGVRVARVVIGDVDERATDVLAEVEETLLDAAGTPARLRAIRVPVDETAIRRAVAAAPQLREHEDADLRELGRVLGEELVAGGETPLWDALSPLIVAQRSGTLLQPVDAVVVARSAPAQTGDTADFVRGIYEGLQDVPAVGVEGLAADPSAIPTFARADLSTVDNVDTRMGRLALALLLAGANPGNYGVKDTAGAALPPVEPLRRRPTRG